MEKKDTIENEIERTLSSIDGIERTGVNPYLFNKIALRLEEKNETETRFNFKLALGVVIVCIIVNFAAFLFIPQYSDSANYVREYEIKSFASEYSSINNFYFY